MNAQSPEGNIAQLCANLEANSQFIAELRKLTSFSRMTNEPSKDSSRVHNLEIRNEMAAIQAVSDILASSLPNTILFQIQLMGMTPEVFLNDFFLPMYLTPFRSHTAE